MPYFFPGSSSLFYSQPPEPPPPAPAIADKLAELSLDEPLPETYAADRIRLLSQSPRRLYLYWEFKNDPFETLRRAFRWQAEHYQLVVRLTDLETGMETLHLASRTRSQWFDVQQGHAYRAEVGFYAQGRAFIRLLSSERTRTPRAAVSHATDSSPQFKVTPDQFAHVLDDAGYVSDALEVSLEAADLSTQNAATRTVARELTGRGAPLMSAEELAEMRGLLASLALGADAKELQVTLSARLARWLEEARGETQAALDAQRLIEIFRAVLGLEMERTTFGLVSAEVMRRTVRFIIGASEVNLPLRPFHLWMPSMSPSLLERMNGA
jgi:hypothetical protein